MLSTRNFGVCDELVEQSNKNITILSQIFRSQNKGNESYHRVLELPLDGLFLGLNQRHILVMIPSIQRHIENFLVHFEASAVSFREK